MTRFARRPDDLDENRLATLLAAAAERLQVIGRRTPAGVTGRAGSRRVATLSRDVVMLRWTFYRRARSSGRALLPSAASGGVTCQLC